MSDKEEPNFDALETDLGVSVLDQDAVQMHELYKSLLKAGFRDKAALYLVAMIVNESMEDNAGVTFTMLDPEEMDDDPDNDGTEVWKIASSEDEKVDKIFTILTTSGALEWVGVNEEGEPIYRVTQLCKDIFPEFYEMYRAEISQMANELWQMGLVEILFNPDGSNSVTFTNNNYSRYRELKDQLNDEQINFLESVVGSSLKGLDPRL